MYQINNTPGNESAFESANGLKLFYSLSKNKHVENSVTNVTYEEVMLLLDTIDVDISMLCYLLGISGTDFMVIKKKREFTSEQSAIILSIANLYGHGYSLFGCRRNFNNWMKYGSLRHGSVPPFSLLNQQKGIEEVRNALCCFERGIAC